MKQFLIRSVLALAFLSVVSSALAIDRPKVTGVIQALEKDEQGNNIAIMLDTGEEAYLVVLEEQHKTLLEMEGKKVTLEGQITIDNEDDQKTITVKKYRVHDSQKEKAGPQHP